MRSEQKKHLFPFENNDFSSPDIYTLGYCWMGFDPRRKKNAGFGVTVFLFSLLF